MVYIFSQNEEHRAHSAIVTLNRSRKMREILGMALELAQNGGLDNLTLHRLAERMDRSIAAVYRYFPSREAVISELQRLIATHVGVITADAHARIDSWAAREQISPSDIVLTKILAAGEVYGLYGRESSSELGLVTHFLSRPDYILPERDAAHVFNVVNDSLSELAALITDAQDRNALTPGNPQDRAVMFWAALQGSIDVLKVVRRGGWSPETALTQHMIETLLTGWGADPATLVHLTHTITDLKLARIDRAAQDLLIHETHDTNETAANSGAKGRKQ